MIIFIYLAVIILVVNTSWVAKLVHAPLEVVQGLDLAPLELVVLI